MQELTYFNFWQEWIEFIEDKKYKNYLKYNIKNVGVFHSKENNKNYESYYPFHCARGIELNTSMVNMLHISISSMYHLRFQI
jgi:hypothetical protein